MNAEQRDIITQLVKETHLSKIDDARSTIRSLRLSIPLQPIGGPQINIYPSTNYISLESEGYSFAFYLETIQNVRQTWSVIDPTSEHYNNNWLRDIAETCNEMNTILDSSPEQWYRYPKESITSPALDSIGSKTKWFCWRRVGGMTVPQDDVWG